MFPFISCEQVAICWSLKSTLPICELYILITFGCAKYFVCHWSADLTFLSSWPGTVESRWTSFLSFHVTQTELLLCQKRGSPLWSLLTSLLLGSTMSFGRKFLFALIVPPQASILLSIVKKVVQLYTSCQQTTCNPYQNRVPLAGEQHAWPSLCWPQDPRQCKP